MLIERSAVFMQNDSEKLRVCLFQTSNFFFQHDKNDFKRNQLDLEAISRGASGKILTDQ